MAEEKKSSPVAKNKNPQEKKGKVDLNEDVEAGKQNTKLRPSSKKQPQTAEAKKHFVVGEYDIAVPQSKVPLLGTMLSAVILFIAIFARDLLDTHKYYARYGLVLCLVTFVLALITIVLPSKNHMVKGIKYFMFIWCLVGACVLTFGSDAPFERTGNGYFAAWGCALFASVAADAPGALSKFTLDKMNALIDLGAATVTLLVALGFEYHYRNRESTAYTSSYDKFELEIVYATIVAGLTLIFVFSTSFHYTCQGDRVLGECVVLTILSVLWIVAACAVTFSGPFLFTGNGYFASWFAFLTAVRATFFSWEHRNDVNVNSNRNSI